MNTNILRMPVIRSLATAYDTAEALIAALNIGDTISMNGMSITKIGDFLVWAEGGFEHYYHTSSHTYTSCELGEFVFSPERKAMNDWIRTWATGEHDMQFFLDHQQNALPQGAAEYLDDIAFHEAYGHAIQAGERHEYTTFKVQWYAKNVPADRNPYRIDGDLAEVGTAPAPVELEPFIEPDDDDLYVESLLALAGAGPEAGICVVEDDGDEYVIGAVIPNEQIPAEAEWDTDPAA